MGGGGREGGRWKLPKRWGQGEMIKLAKGREPPWGGPLRATKEGVRTNSKGYGKQEVQAHPSYRE